MPLPEGEVEDDVFVIQQREISNDDPFLQKPASRQGAFWGRSTPAIGVAQHRRLPSSSATASRSFSTLEGEETLRDDGGLGDVLVVSGGSGYNALVGATPGATFVMPVSDNGGSSSEIIRVLGGPSLGDLRSRLVRLIPLSTDHDRDPPAPRCNDALHALLSHRLPSEGRSRDIKQEWMDILEGRHFLWKGIESERKECIRGFLVYFESEILRRAHRNFDFRGGSIGNFFLAAAQKFFRSIQSAIFLFSATTLINTTRAGRVLPVINTNHTATIAATLQDGQVILGQCEISHPARSKQSLGTAVPPHSGLDTPASAIFDPLQSMSLPSKVTVGSLGDGLDPDPDMDEYEGAGPDDEDVEEEEGGEGRGSMRAKLSNIVFAKEESIEGEVQDKLPSPVDRLFYVNAYGNEVQPAPNPEYLISIYKAKTLLYSCGSLWTSIVPCLALRGVAKAITTAPLLRYKILLLNTRPDRETYGLTGLDYVRVIVGAMGGVNEEGSTIQLKSAVTHIIYSPEGKIPLDVEAMKKFGVECVAVHLPPDKLLFEEGQVKQALDEILRQGSV